MTPFDRLRRSVIRLTGRDLAPYKLSVLRRRLRIHAGKRAGGDEETYLDLLESGGSLARAEAQRLARSLSVPVTGFFRDPETYGALSRHVVPPLVEKLAGGRSVRVWSAGSASGQEAYSLAMVLRRAARRKGVENPDVTVVGTDVDSDEVAEARHGLYRDEDVRALPVDLRNRYLVPQSNRWAVGPELRRSVRFVLGDVLDPNTHPQALDLIACRNLLIYLERAAQERLLLQFLDDLRPGGFCVLGTSETVLGRPWARLEHVDPARRIYRKPLSRNSIPAFRMSKGPSR